MSHRTREIHLVARPRGEPKPSDFQLVEAELPDPKPGELLVRCIDRLRGEKLGKMLVRLG
jgi:NADPH-dependent curcumin reductase CurA